MPKNKEAEIERQEYRVKPKHHAMVRGVEYKEGEFVSLSYGEFNQLCDANCVSRFVPVGEWEAFIADYNAGQIDHTGKPFQTAPEAKEPEAGA